MINAGKIKNAASLRDATKAFLDNVLKDYSCFSKAMAPFSEKTPLINHDNENISYNELAWFLDYFSNAIAPLQTLLSGAKMNDELFGRIASSSLRKLLDGKERFSQMLITLDSLSGQHIEDNTWVASHDNPIPAAIEHLRSIKMQTEKLLSHPVVKAMLETRGNSRA